MRRGAPIARRAPAPEVLRPAGRLPPHDLEAERAVLSALLLDASRRLPAVLGAVRPADFYSEGHRLILEAVVALSADARPVDTVEVAGWLRDRERLGRIGGAAYLAEIVDATPSVYHVEAHALRIANLARRRRLIDRAHLIAAEGYGEVGEAWEQEAARSLTEIAEETTQRGTIAAAWRPLPAEFLFEAPPARRWLIRHPTRDGEECPPGTGDGMLPLGKAGLLLAEGGAGKTMAAIQLAIGVASGRKWLGHFEISPEARRGRVLLALGEEELEEVHRRMWSASEAMGLTVEERAMVAARVVVLPLAGRPVALLKVAEDGATIVETDELVILRRLLRDDAGACAVHPGVRADYPCEGCARSDRYPRGGPHPGVGWSLVVLDPLARWAGPDVEADNAAATRFVQAVESLVDAPGNPAVVVAHHSSKAARATGRADSRGVSAITDGFRWAGTLRAEKEGVLFGQQKSNYSRPMHDEVSLRRREGGLLSVPSAEEEARAEAMREERQAAKLSTKDEADEAAIARATRDLLHAIATAAAPITSRSALVGLVRGRNTHKQAAVSRLIASRRIIQLASGFVLVSDSVEVSPS